jgi:hypothetical protein
MTTSSIAADAAADARFQEEIAAQYRDYLAYLDAHLTLLDIQAARIDIAFERAETRDDDEQAARHAIAALPAQRRALFDAVVEGERQEAQRQLEAQVHGAGDRQRRADPDQAARIALTRLRDEAHGIGTEGGKGLLPYGKPDAIKWYAVDGAALRAAPTAAAYSAGALDTKTRKRMVTQAGGAIVVILLAVIWLLVPKGSPQSTALPPVARANGVSLTAWPMHALVLIRAHGDPTTLPISATTSLLWPGDDAGTTQVYWRSAMVWPLRLCVPSAMLADLVEIQLLGSGATPARMYTVVSTASGAADLVLEPCQGGTNVPAPRIAVLRATTALPFHAIGEAVALPNGSVTLSAMTLTGSGDDPSLPSNQARVTVHIQTALKLDWPLLAPTLLLPSGVAALPSDLTATANGIDLIYLIPQPSESLELMWSVTPRANAPVLRWRTTLDPPPSRAAVLRDALEVRQVQAVPGDTPASVVISITVANRSAAPLVLTSADVKLESPTGLLASPDLAVLRQPLAPQEQRTLTLRAPLGERETVTLTVGVARYAIESTERR